MPSILLRTCSPVSYTHLDVYKRQSLDTGVKIAGDDKSPSLYVSPEDSESVRIAAENMKTDLESVTGKDVSLNGSSEVTTLENDDAAITAIDTAAGTMTCLLYTSCRPPLKEHSFALLKCCKTAYSGTEIHTYPLRVSIVRYS